MIPEHEFPGITLISLLHFGWALVWAVGVFASITGYGAATLRGFRVKRAGWALAACAGFGPTILIAGALNLAHQVKPIVLLSFLLLGFGLAAWTARGEAFTTEYRGMARLIVGALVLVSAVRIASTVHSINYEVADDLNFYLAAPKKMMETHSFAADPFSERRITSSLGGNQFLDTLILVTQPIESVQMADWALGAFLLLLAAFAIGEEFQLTALQRAGFALLVMIVPQIRLNLTPVVLPSALFLGMVYVAAHRRLTENQPALQACLLGGMVGAIATMKSTYLPHAVIFICCLALLRWWLRDFRAGYRLLGLAAVCCFVTMLPWMVASHQTSGTWMFPMLGKGFHYSAYGMYPPPESHDAGVLTRKVLPFCLPILALFGVECWLSERDERRWTAAALTLAAFAATLLVSLATGGDSVKRFNFPCILPAVCLLFVVCARWANSGDARTAGRGMQGAAAMLIVALALTVGLSKFTREYEVTLRSLRTSLSDYRITNPELRHEYAAVEDAIPADDSASLSTTSVPFLFDFGRRNILLGDSPGAASLPPGWPARQPGEALAQYLLSLHIRYLVYGYGECGDHPAPETCAEMEEREAARRMVDSQTTAWIHSEVEAERDAERQFIELGGTRRHLYDDGRIFVLDLAR